MSFTHEIITKLGNSAPYCHSDNDVTAREDAIVSVGLVVCLSVWLKHPAQDFLHALQRKRVATKNNWAYSSYRTELVMMPDNFILALNEGQGHGRWHVQ